MLNGDKRVAPKTRAKVLEVITKSGYTPKPAREQKQRQSGFIGVVASDVTNPFYPELLEAIAGRLAERGFEILLHRDRTHRDQLASPLLEQRIDGLVVLSALMDSPMVRELAHRRVPLVLVNRYVDDVDCDFAIGDNAAGASEAAHHLLSLGHRRIGVLTGVAQSSNSRDRLDAFSRALTEVGAALDPELVRPAEFKYEQAYAATIQLLAHSKPPTALFCLNDLMAFGALNAAARLGISVPADLSVVGFDDLRMAGWEVFSLTTVRQPLPEMAIAAVDMLVQRIASPDRQPKRLVFPSNLVVRSTTGPAPLPEPLEPDKRSPDGRLTGGDRSEGQP